MADQQQPPLNLREVAPVNPQGFDPGNLLFPQAMEPNVIPVPAAQQPGTAAQVPIAQDLHCGAGNAVPAMPQDLPCQVMRHRNFASLYHDEARDPMRQRYPAILQRFDAMNNAPIAGDSLFEMILGNPSIPNTFLCCALLNGQTRPRVYVIHTISKYVPSIDGRITPWDNRIFGYLGELLGGSPMTVILPNTSFNSAPCYVYNDATFAAQLPNLNNGDLFPRLTATHQDAVHIHTRSLMYLPTKYAPLLLDNKGYTLQEAWNVLIPAFQAANSLDTAAPILAWLRASLHATNANNRGPPVTTLTLTAPFLDQDLAEHRQALLHNFLPALSNPQDSGLNSAIVQMANAVATQATEAHTARLAREIERDQPVLPSVKFRSLFTLLKGYLNVADENELPEFWFSLAAAPKKQEFSVIRESLDAYSRTDGAFLNVAPVPSPKLVSDLTTMTFVSDHPDDLKTGIQPFVVMDGSEEYRLAAQDLARNYTFLVEKDLGISYTDLNSLKLPKDLRSHPTSYFELEKSLGLFGNFTHVVLGAAHPISVHFRNFWNAFTKQFRTQLHYEIDTRRIIKPVHILRNIQLICYHWFQAKRSLLPPPDPQFLDILTRISLSLYSNPNLPSALYQLIQPPKPTFKLLLGDAHKSMGDDDNGTAATGLSTLTPGSNLSSGLSALGTNSGATTGSSRAGTFTKNTSCDPALQGLLPAGIKIADLVGSDPVPMGDDNVPICLSYHIHSGCFSNCRRKDNHAKVLSVADKQRLSNWIVDQTAKLKAKFAIG
jgi:hypothetical protein